MEPVMMFSGLVGLTCVLHLVARGAKALGLDSTAAKSKDQKAQKDKRGEWYVFFDCRDLHGTSSAANDAGKGDSLHHGLRKGQQKPRPRAVARPA